MASTLPDNFIKHEKDRTPVSVVTGFLGSGKTTLLNYILTANHGRRIAVIENEYGEVGIDDALVTMNTDEEIFEMNNGCVCCTVRGDLIRILTNLGKRRSKFDLVLIETTGLADPGPIIQTFYMDEEIANMFALDAVITVVDLKHVLLHLQEKKEKGVTNETVEQVAFADRILLNKKDLVTPEYIEEVKEHIRDINQFCTMFVTEKATIELDKILGIGAFSLDRVLADDPHFLEDDGHHHHDHGSDEECGPDCKDPTHDHHHHHKDKDHEHKEKKPKKDHGDGDHEHKEKKKDKKEKHHDHHKHKTKHDSDVSSFGVVIEEPLNYSKTNQWLRRLLMEKGTDLYRMKGIISFAGEDKRFVFQGVHMILDAQPGAPWKADEKRITKIVFIGKNLDEESLEKSLNECKA